MSDTTYFEGKGLPCAALLSDEFKSQAVYQARQLGMSHAVRIFVSHPISDQSVKQLEAKADAVLHRVCFALTHDDLAVLQRDEDGGATHSSVSAPSVAEKRSEQGGEDCSS